MKKPWIMIVALLFVLPAIVVAQHGGQGRPKGGNSKPNSGSSSKDAPASRPEKQADLSAASITAKWKDAKTLEITAVVKNSTTTSFSGMRTATLKIQGKDGKTESVKEESLPLMSANSEHKIVFETTDAKYLDKDLKWTLEIQAGDGSPGNDKKTMSLTIPPKPKG
jgi:hypothetical protein